MNIKALDLKEVSQKLQVGLLVVLPLVGTVAAMRLLWNQVLFPKDIVLLVVFYVLTAMGITIGYHRMLTHRGFEGPSWLRGLFLILGSMAMEGPADRWTATHIKHHAHSDQKGDPHSPLEGFWHAHLGWLFSYQNFAEVADYAPHLQNDKVVMWVSRWVGLWSTLSIGLPFLLGGWTGLLWGGAVRIFLVNHVTWSVNSIYHCFGKRPFATTDVSRNHWLVGLLALGEGWHNNHHAFPSSAFHGLRWWQFDLSGLVIRGMERIGVIWNVERVSQEVMAASLSKARGAEQAFVEMREQLVATISGAKQTLEEVVAGASAGLHLHFPVTTAESIRMALSSIHQETLTRLEELHARLTQLQNMKRQRMLSYQVEIRELVRQTTERIDREVKRFA